MFKMLSPMVAFALMLFSLPSVFAFEDVPSTHKRWEAINTLANDGIISGYQDGTFQPDKLLSRAEFIKLIIESSGGVPQDFSYSNCYDDVPNDAWFAPHVCFAKSKNILSGESKTFNPERTVNVAEAAKISTLALQVTPITSQPEKAWYVPFLTTLSEKSYLPRTFSHTDQQVRRGDAAELLFRISYQHENRLSRNLDEITEGKCIYDPGYTYPKNVDMDRVRSTWLQWNNKVRTDLGRTPFTYATELEGTAMSWSQTAKERGTINHKRTSSAPYYDYFGIMNWFKSKGVTFSNIGGSTYTENIGWGVYSCNQEDCTDRLLASIKTTFDFFMSEKGRAYSPHYDSIINGNFRLLGMGVVVNESTRRYYLTVHYAAGLTSPPTGICGLDLSSTQ